MPFAPSLCLHLCICICTSQSSCYRYQLSDQYISQNSDRNTIFNSQRHSNHYPPHTRLRTPYRNALNDSQADRTTGSKTEAHISNFGPHAHTQAWLGNQMQTPSLRTNGNHSPHHKPHLRPFCLAITAQKHHRVKNRYMYHEGHPLNIKDFPPYHVFPPHSHNCYIIPLHYST